MGLHLAEISQAVAPGGHAVVLLDQAGWHTSAKLKLPANISLLPLPPKSPELNPTENVWQYLRDNWLSNRVFASGRDSDLNIRGAYLHMAADALVSAGVVAAGLVIAATGWLWLDPLTSLVISALIVAGTWGLLRDSAAMSLDAMPAWIDPDAVRRLLEARPGLRGRVVFVAMVYPSRQGLAEYLAYANEVEQTVARINERWATRDWTPVVLDDRDDFARSVAGLQRYDVLLVNALRDGLNLVAKEGPVVNRRDGVLCLSPEAGAYDELKPAALPVHPYDIEQCAGALETALAMPLDERAARAASLRDLATRRSPAHWLADLVGHARE